ncbi:MAG: PCMD domain-containing protein [Chitinophagaceae bacterium]|jgi:hypothetical protein|nr:PCMD domain-containing protein [Chitinophagaceae bacterium]
MNRIFFAAALAFASLLSSCVKEDYFGRSTLKQIRYFTVEGQSGSTRIIEDSLLIRIVVGAAADITQLKPDSIQLSSYARIEPGVGTARNFSVPQQYTVTAEDGSTAQYTVVVEQEGANPQLENAGFDDWYTPTGKNYQEPGQSASTIWATGNAGVVTISTANVTPVTVSGNDKAVQLVTKDLGSLGQLVGQRMGAGSIFTGSFVLDINNPLNSTRFGVPFSARPKSFTISYSYQPGTPYRNNKGTIIDKQDSCDIYLLLENRETTTARRIATGWFRSSETVSSFRDITIPIIYGPLPGNSPAYSFPANGAFGNAGDKITHISFVAASSSSGALFEGGVNSTLTINNLRLNY